MRENTTTEPTMLSARNFPAKREEKEGELQCQAKAERGVHFISFLLRVSSLATTLTESVDVELVNEVPKPLNDILHLLHALPLWQTHYMHIMLSKNRRTSNMTAMIASS